MSTQTEERASAPPGARTERAEGALRPSASGVTIVVPAYNEEGAIGGVVERLCALELGVPTELLVVDDGSSDGTPAALDVLDERFDSLTVVRHRENSGYGAALKTGFARARHDVVVITDADGTYPESSIAELLERIDDGADMAVGSRTGSDVHIPLIRRPAKAFLRWMASFLAGTPIPDLNSGLRAFRRDFVLAYRPILPQGFSFTTTITLAALTNGHVVDYIRINYAAREGRSKIRPVRDTLGFLALILRTVLYFNPLKVFYPLAGVMTVLLAALLYHDLVLSDPPNLGDSTVVLFVAVVQILSVGLLADLIEKKARL
ncbi:MAG: glycosyltransferase family 2 protein [Planctomycetota bacterium]|jgi:glycosyltransferase involved in cell wall biosynthesis|nr:glycosyltransferase family 2 protein [Planctomycetota bacterium]MDP6762264.1 glycosyltransferase family 2 protein [Planctomycetota bacterium]MDP6988133.1 glycosyltransferase family 2 protein [Planctomycetota bacterium]